MPATNHLHSEYLSNSLIFWHLHRRRFVHAIGPGATVFSETFVGFANDPVSGPPGWTTTFVEAGAGESTFLPGDVAGGAGVITTDAAENDGISAQVTGECFELPTTKDLYFGIRFKVDEATQSDLFAGLAITDTAILGGVTDRIGFEKLDGSTQINFVAEKDSVQTTVAAGTAVDDTYHTLEFHWDGDVGNVTVFFDDVEVVTKPSTNIPNNELMRVSLEFLTGEAVAHTMTIDWVRAIMIDKS